MAPDEDNGTTPPLTRPEPVGGLEMDTKVRDDKPLPRQFETIRTQLEPEHLAKLRAIDKSRAMVSLCVRGGRRTQPMPLAGFVLDFAQEAAEEMGTGGPMLAIVDPNDGQLEIFAFGFLAPGKINKGESGSSEITLLREQIRAMNEKMERQQQLVLLSAGGGGGASRKEMLEEMMMFKQLFKDDRPAVDPNAQFAAMGQGFSAMCTAMGTGMKSMREVSGELVKAPDKSFASEIKEVMSIDGAPDLAKTIVDRVLPAKNKNSVANQNQHQQTAPRANPLERLAS